MKRVINILSLGAIMLTLYGCPYSSAYKLDAEPQENIDESLIGKWAVMIKKPNSYQEEPVKLTLAKKTDQEYAVSITGVIDEIRPYIIFADDSIKGTAYLSAAANKRFLNLFIKDRTYIIEVKMDNGKLSLMPLSEHFTSKMIKSCDALRVALEFHYKTRFRAMYDDDFCLKDMVKVN